MRLVGMLLLLLLLIFAGQSVYLRLKTESATRNAIENLPQNPTGAYKAIQPIIETSGILTLGLSTDSVKRFADTLRDRSIERLDDDDIGVSFFQNFEDGFRILKEIEEKYRLPFKDHRIAMAQALHEKEPELRGKLPLDVWDTFVKTTTDGYDRGFIPVESFTGIGDWVAGLGQVDRRSIGEREAMRFAEAGLKAGVEALGLQPSEASDEPLLGALPLPIDDLDLIDADEQFSRAKGALDKYAERFGPEGAPPSLAMIYNKIEYNLAAIRVAHLVDLGERAQAESSSYIVDLLVPENPDNLPSNAELYGSFVNGLGGFLQRLQRMFYQPGGLAPAEATALQAALGWTISQFGRATRGNQMAVNGLNRFREIQAATQDPAISGALTEMETSRSVSLILR